MASARPIRNPQPLPPPDGVILTLDREEAQVLRSVLSSIAGDASNFRRGLTDRINAALFDAGFNDYTTEDFSGYMTIERRK